MTLRGSPARRAAAWARRSPWLIASLATHLALLGGLYMAGPRRAGREAAALSQQRVAESLQAAARRGQAQQMHKRVQALEEIHRRMTGAPAGPAAAALPGDPQALLARAEMLAAAIRTAEQKARADELARLLKTTPDQALARLQAEARAQAASAVPPPATPASAIETLERAARAALARQQGHDQRARQGQPVRAAAADGGSGSSPGGRGGLGRGLAGNGGQGQAGVGGAGGGSGDAALAGALDSDTFAGDVRRYGEMRLAPALDASTLRLAPGRSFGAGGVPANRVLIDKWYIAGPFEGDDGRAALQRAYPPELGVDLDAAYAGKGGRTLHWRYLDKARYPLVPEPRAQSAVYYAYTELRSDVARDVWLDIGADDDSKLWFNDTLVWTSDASDKPWYHTPFYNLGAELAQMNLTEGSLRVRLLPGHNRLLFKLYNGIDLMFFSVVLRP